MKNFVYSTHNPEPDVNDTSVYAKLYRKYNFREIFESYLSWGPTYIEIHASSTPCGQNLTINTMYYTEHNEEAPREHLELLCNSFNLPIKAVKK